MSSKKQPSKKKKQSKVKPLHRGGLALVSTPNMRYMAEPAYQELCALLGKKRVSLHDIEFTRFSKREILPQIQGNVRGKHVFLFYDFNGDSCHDAFVLLLVISALEGAGADSITLMLPYMPFLRQDRKDRGRVPISASVFIRSFEQFERVERTITIDMHSEQAQMGFRRRFDHLPGHVIFEPWIRSEFGHCLDQLVIIGPDAGAEKRVRKLAEKLGCGSGHLIKDRTSGTINVSQANDLDVRGRICILNDDIIDTGGSTVGATTALKEAGAREIVISGTHAVFGKGAYKRLKETGCRVVVTDSLKTKTKKWKDVLPLGRFLAHTILQNEIEGGSVSNIIDNGLPAKAV